MASTNKYTERRIRYLLSVFMRQDFRNEFENLIKEIHSLHKLPPKDKRSQEFISRLFKLGDKYKIPPSDYPQIFGYYYVKLDYPRTEQGFEQYLRENYESELKVVDHGNKMILPAKSPSESLRKYETKVENKYTKLSEKAQDKLRDSIEKDKTEKLIIEIPRYTTWNELKDFLNENRSNLELLLENPSNPMFSTPEKLKQKRINKPKAKRVNQMVRIIELNEQTNMSSKEISEQLLAEGYTPIDANKIRSMLSNYYRNGNDISAM